MRIKVNPLIKEFTLEWKPEGYEGEPGRFSIRQATVKDNVALADLSSEVKRVYEGKQMVLQQRFSLEERHRKMIFLTLVDCNFEDDETGAPIFKFANGRLAMSEKAFNEAYGNLPPALVQEIFQRVLEVNPHWDFGLDDDTEGEY